MVFPANAENPPEFGSPPGQFAWGAEAPRVILRVPVMAPDSSPDYQMNIATTIEPGALLAGSFDLTRFPGGSE